MKRTLMFLLLGPASAALFLFLIGLTAIDANHRELAQLAALILLLVTLPISAFVGCVDGCLAGTLPVASRATLSALLGAAIAFGLIWALGPPTSPMPWAFATGGALCMGVCSLLSNDDGRRQRLAVPVGVG
jgi:hypothetical protein